jgi:hypothetical protein
MKNLRVVPGRDTSKVLKGNSDTKPSKNRRHSYG